MLSQKEWLAKFGQDPCNDCQYHIAARAKCTYKKGYCVRYDEYRRDEQRRKPQQLKLF